MAKTSNSLKSSLLSFFCTEIVINIEIPPQYVSGFWVNDLLGVTGCPTKREVLTTRRGDGTNQMNVHVVLLKIMR